MQTPKIAQLPRHILGELNHRLDRAEAQKHILAWLNSLPEVQAILTRECGGRLITKQNLSDWKKSGFRRWQLLRSALDFVNDTAPDDLDTSALEQMSAKLIRHLQLRYAALAGSLPHGDKDPEAELRRLSGLCQDLTALRRGDLSAQRLALEQERLIIEKARSEQELEQLFWTWTQRPDIQQKLHPNRDPEQTRRDVDRLVTERMLGIRRESSTPQPAADPSYDI